MLRGIGNLEYGYLNVFTYIENTLITTAFQVLKI